MRTVDERLINVLKDIKAILLKKYDGGGNGGNGGDDSENDEELNAFMEFFDGLDDSYKKVPFIISIGEYNDDPLPEQDELFGNKDTASDALAFKGNDDDFVVAFVSDDLCKKLVGWCFNYYGDNAKATGEFSPIPLVCDGLPFLVADKLPLLVEKCMVPNEITDTNVGAGLVYALKDSATTPSNYPYTMFPVNSSYDDYHLIIKFEDGNKIYYAPGFTTLQPIG